MKKEKWVLEKRQTVEEKKYESEKEQKNTRRKRETRKNVGEWEKRKRRKMNIFYFQNLFLDGVQSAMVINNLFSYYPSSR